MDRPNLPAMIIDEVVGMLAKELGRIGPELLESDLDGIEQRLQDVSRRVMGKVIEGVVSARVRRSIADHPQCTTCQHSMRLVDGARPRHLQGLVGDYTLARPYYRCAVCHESRVPLDEELGVGVGALSPGLARVACRLGIEDSFGESVNALEEALRVNVAREADRRITEGIGQVAEDEEQAAITRAQAGHDPLAQTKVLPPGSVLLVEVDGAMVHLEDDWHEVKVGLAAPLGPTTRTDPKTGRETLTMGQPSYCAGFESAELFWYRAYVEACRQGLGSVGLALIVVLGDGADWIWRYAARFLAVGTASIIEIVDIYHAWEHLGTVAEAVFADVPTRFAWVEPLKTSLLTDGVAPLLDVLAKLSPHDPHAAEEIRKALGYFTTNATRMDYPRFLALHLPIGSGAIESTCKTLIEEREKGAGMRWTKGDAQAVASLRALWRSGRWSAFWQTHPQRRRPNVFARPKPTRSLDCIKQAA